MCELAQSEDGVGDHGGVFVEKLVGVVAEFEGFLILDLEEADKGPDEGQGAFVLGGSKPLSTLHARLRYRRFLKCRKPRHRRKRVAIYTCVRD